MNVLFTFNLRTHTHKNAALQLAFSLVNKKKPFLNSFFFFFFLKQTNGVLSEFRPLVFLYP